MDGWLKLHQLRTYLSGALRQLRQRCADGSFLRSQPVANPEPLDAGHPRRRPDGMGDTRGTLAGPNLTWEDFVEAKSLWHSAEDIDA